MTRTLNPNSTKLDMLSTHFSKVFKLGCLVLLAGLAWSAAAMCTENSDGRMQIQLPVGLTVLAGNDIALEGARGIRVDGPADGPQDVKVELTASHGILALIFKPSGVRITAGSGGNQNLTLAGALQEVNGMLAGLEFTPEAKFSGKAVIGVTLKTANAPAASIHRAAFIRVFKSDAAPVMSGRAKGVVFEERAYRFQPKVTPVDPGDRLAFSIQNKPDWALFDSQTGALTGTPAKGSAGTYKNIVIAVADHRQASDRLAPFHIVVRPGNHPPVAADGKLNIQPNTVAAGILIASDVEEDELTYVIAQPATLGTVVITDAAAGGFTYVPNIDVQGQDSFAFQVTDELGASATAVIRVTIGTPETAAPEPTVVAEPETTAAPPPVPEAEPVEVEIAAQIPVGGPAFGTIPSPLVAFDPNDGVQHAILVEKDMQQLSLVAFQDNAMREIYRFDCSTGEVAGAKLRSGDRKTPEGVYFFTHKHFRKDLTPIYGSRAFPLDYPHRLDRQQGRGGHSIWLHGTNKPLKARNSNGCIVLVNTDIDRLTDVIELHRTPIIVVKRLTYESVERQTVNARQVNTFLARFEDILQHRTRSSYLDLFLPPGRAPMTLGGPSGSVYGPISSLWGGRLSWIWKMFRFSNTMKRM